MAGKKIQTQIIIGGKLSESLQKAFDKAKSNSKTLENAYQACKNVGVTAFKAIATAATAVTTATIAAAESTREYRRDLSKLYNNAELAGLAQKEAWSGLEDLYALSGEFDSANEAMSNLIATGYKGKDLTKIIEAVNGATIKWQDTITQESLADAINETVMSGKSVGQFDEILARSGVNLDTFNDGLLTCTGLAERQQYVLKWLANSGLTEVNEAYQKQNKTLIEAQKADLKYQNSMAELGGVAEKLTPSIRNLAAEGISYFASKLKGVDMEKVSKALDKAGKLGKQAFDTIWNALSKIDWDKVINAGMTILSIFTSICNFVVNNWSGISPIIYGIVAAMVAYKVATVASNTVTAISNVLQGISAAKAALLQGATLKQAAAAGIAALAQNGLNLAFLACPITWIVIAIGAVIAIIVALANKVGGFKKLWEICWNGITSFLQGCGKVIMGILQPILDLITWVGDALSGIFGGGGKANYSVSVDTSNAAKNVAKNAEGSTITRPTLTWVGEGGDTETIVPHNSKPRSKALALEAVRGTGLNVGGNTYVFSPTINANGGSAYDIQSMLEDKFNEFMAMVEARESEKRRLAY